MGVTLYVRPSVCNIEFDKHQKLWRLVLLTLYWSVREQSVYLNSAISFNFTHILSHKSMEKTTLLKQLVFVLKIGNTTR